MPLFPNYIFKYSIIFASGWRETVFTFLLPYHKVSVLLKYCDFNREDRNFGFSKTIPGECVIGKLEAVMAYSLSGQNLKLRQFPQHNLVTHPKCAPNVPSPGIVILNPKFLSRLL